MISGQFAGPGGRVTLEGTVWIEHYATSIVVEFLIDPSSPRSYLAAADLGLADLPLDDIVQVVESNSPATNGIPVLALIWFDGDGERYSFHVQAILTGERTKSRLGWDVLNRWLTVIDPEGRSALFQPQSWDSTSATP